MVTSKTFERLMTISEQIAIKAGTDPAVAKNVLEAARDDIISRRRQPAPAVPEGGISIRAAARKYYVGCPLLSDWRKRGILLTLLETNKEIYISEESVIKAVTLYKQDPGRGKRIVIKTLDPNYLHSNTK